MKTVGACAGLNSRHSTVVYAWVFYLLLDSLDFNIRFFASLSHADPYLWFRTDNSFLCAIPWRVYMPIIVLTTLTYMYLLIRLLYMWRFIYHGHSPWHRIWTTAEGHLVISDLTKIRMTKWILSNCITKLKYQNHHET